MKLKTIGIVGTLAIVWGALNASAQSFSLEGYVIAGGGGTSIGGPFAVSGTIGQPDASTVSSGGNYAVQGGFWSRYSAVQTIGAPKLTITRVGNSIEITWPVAGSSSYVLERTSSFGAPITWLNDNSSVITTDGFNKVTIAIQPGHHFFRLSVPQ